MITKQTGHRTHVCRDLMHLGTRSFQIRCIQETLLKFVICPFLFPVHTGHVDALTGEPCKVTEVSHCQQLQTLNLFTVPCSQMHSAACTVFTSNASLVCVFVQTLPASSDPYFLKGSQSLNGHPSPPAQQPLGSRTNGVHASLPQSTSLTSPRAPQSVRRGGSSHSLRGLDNHHYGPATNYHSAAPSWQLGDQRAPISVAEDLSPRSPPTRRGVNDERFTPRSRHRSVPDILDGGGEGGGSLGRYGDRDRDYKPHSIRVTSPYVTQARDADGFPCGPSSSSYSSTMVRDRPKIYHTAHNKSRENLSRSRENVARSREFLSRSREAVHSGEDSLGRKREASVSSYYSASSSVPVKSFHSPSDIVDGHVPGEEGKGAQHGHSVRLKRWIKESGRSRNSDRVTSYEASV